MQRGQPGLQRQQRRHHGAQHGRVPGQPVQPPQRRARAIPRRTRQLPPQPGRRPPPNQRHAQLLQLTVTHLPGPIRPKHTNTYVPVRSCPL